MEEKRIVPPAERGILTDQPQQSITIFPSGVTVSSKFDSGNLARCSLAEDNEYFINCWMSGDGLPYTDIGHYTIASTVTMRGRQMIEETKNYVEEHFPGAKVRYGDSVMPGTPVITRTNGIVSVRTIETLGCEWN